MRTVLVVAADLLREAANRRWFLALGLGVTALLALVAFGLRLDVVDGALAATQLFGKSLDTDIRAADVSLRPVFEAASYLISYAGTPLLILACADFAPGLLAPGRIEYLLSLPVRRWELLAGTFLGVWTIALVAALYAAGGLALILGVKTGVWTTGPIVSALLASASFATLYAAMLAGAVFVQSAALSAAIGAGLFILGIIASFRDATSELFDEGFGQSAFLLVFSVFPRVGSLAVAAANLATSTPMEGLGLSRLLLGMGVFTFAVLALAIWRFEERDF